MISLLNGHLGRSRDGLHGRDGRVTVALRTSYTYRTFRTFIREIPCTHSENPYTSSEITDVLLPGQTTGAERRQNFVRE